MWLTVVRRPSPLALPSCLTATGNLGSWAVHSCASIGGPRVVGDWHDSCVPCDVSRGSAPGEAARAEKLGGSGKVEGRVHPGCTCPLRQSCESHKLQGSLLARCACDRHHQISLSLFVSILDLNPSSCLAEQQQNLCTWYLKKLMFTTHVPPQRAACARHS